MPRYELSQGSSNKFWSIERRGKTVTVVFGRLGTDGQTTVKQLASESESIKTYDKLIREKTGKGYTLAAASPAKRTKPTKATKATKPQQVAGATEASRSTDVEDIMRRAAGAGVGITELARIEKPDRLVATDGLPGYSRGKADKRAGQARAVTIDVRGWPAFAVYRIDSGIVFARFKRSTFPPPAQLVTPLRELIFSRCLVELGKCDANSGVLALLPPRRTVDRELALRIAKAAMTPVSPGHRALLFSVMGAGDWHAAVALPGGLVLAAAPTQYTVWEDSTPVSGPFGTIEKRVLVTNDASVGHLEDA